MKVVYDFVEKNRIPPHGEPPFQIREELKATDTTAWIGKMNNVRNRAAEVVSEEIIYK